MVLQSSGAISLANIQTEFGGSNPIGINEYYRNGSYVTSNNTGVPTSGTIDFNDFYSGLRAVVGTNTANASDTGTGATHTFSSQSLGTADASRIIVVTVGMGVNNAIRTVSSVTVGGTGLTQRVDTSANNSGIENFRSEIWSLGIATGTSADVVVTLSGTIGSNRGVAISVYSLTGGVSATPSATVNDADNSTTTPQLSGNINTVNGGYTIGVGAAFKIGVTATWGGLTEAADRLTGNVGQTSAYHAGTSAESPRTITLDFTTGTTGAQGLAVATWNPA